MVVRPETTHGTSRPRRAAEQGMIELEKEIIVSFKDQCFDNDTPSPVGAVENLKPHASQHETRSSTMHVKYASSAEVDHRTGSST